MIVTVVYTDGVTDNDGMKMTAQIIHCQRLYKLESKTHWGFTAYDHNDTMITKHRFKVGEAEAYITEHGKTVDVLPRR